MLTELNAFIATLLAARPAFAVFRLDSLSVWTVVVIVVHVSVCRWVFRGIRIISRDFCHLNSPFLADEPRYAKIHLIQGLR